LAKWGKTQRLFNKKSADLEALNEIKATKAKGVQSKGENLLVPSVLAPPPDPSPGVHSCLSLSLSLSLLFFLSLQHPVTIINNVFQLVLVLSFRSTPMFYLPASWFQPVSWVFALPFAPSGLPFLSLPVFPPN